MNTSIQIFISPTPVRINAEIDAAEQLVVSAQGTILSEDNTLQITYLDKSTLPIEVEISDFGTGSSRWMVSACHGSHAWERREGGCIFRWSEPVDDLEIEVTATKGGVAKSRPIFIKVQPQGVKPDL